MKQTQPYRLKQRPEGDWVLSRINEAGNKEQLGPYATKQEAEFILRGNVERDTINELKAQNSNLRAARERDKKTIEGLVENLGNLRKSANELSDKHEQLNKVVEYQKGLIAGFEKVSSGLCHRIATLESQKASK